MTTTVELLEITAPRPLTVTQRTSLSPGLGAGPLRVEGRGAPAAAVRGELRTTVCPEAFGEPTEWVDGALQRRADGSFTVVGEVAAGGWFRVEVRLLDGSGAVLAAGAVEPVGIGEVFVIAGQSYAVGCHERHYSVDDPMGRVVAASPEVPAWRYAHDPQPGIEQRIDPQVFTEFFRGVVGEINPGFPLGQHSPYKGSIWPGFANRMLVLERVPVGLVHAAVAATRVGHWAPGSQLFANLVDAVALVGDFRALLWQQGESDAMCGTPTDEYVEELTKIRTTLVDQTGVDRPWLVARSTHHPSDDDREKAEAAVRRAQDLVAELPGFRAGPNTDALRGPDYRAGVYRGGHFTALGQEAAALLWAAEAHGLLRELRVGVRRSPSGRTP
ncbi:MAG: hypothetical protein JJD92_02125 [Frankiaceae bacterium]|nr:hypothetical protein [Frankiaceae bacterium]